MRIIPAIDIIEGEIDAAFKKRMPNDNIFSEMPLEVKKHPRIVG